MKKTICLILSFASILIIACNNLKTVKDIDGNVYKTVKIGEQVWIAENLKTTKYNDGTNIPLVTDNDAWSNLITPGYCWYGNNEATYKNPYGALYNWYALDPTSNGGKNVCPTGWHVSTDAEWTILTTYLGGDSVAGNKMKEEGTTHWQSPNAGATNESGFSALPGGSRGGWGGEFGNSVGYSVLWWSSTESSTGYAYCRTMRSDNSFLYRGDDGAGKPNGFSVRCVKD
jgi:uncharacterized protein (TIGR02145 family)